MDSRKMLMISGHCRVKGLSGVLMNCDTPQKKSTWFFSSATLHLTLTSFSLIAFLYLCFISSS